MPAQISFTLPNGISGYLSEMDISKEWYQVFIVKNGVPYFARQLLKQQGVWRLPDSELEDYAQELGRMVEEAE